MTSLRLGTTAAALVVAIAAAPSAAMAKPPGVATNGVAPIGPRQATAHGTVNPRGQETTYYFEYGPTTAYGTQTPPTSAGAGNRVVKTAKELTGLEPQTSYHYRLVARNASGTANGADRTFSTSSQPLAFAFQAVPPFTTFGRGTTFTGSLTGTGGANRPLVLERRPFPYTSAWQTAGTQTTSPTGAFAFSVSSLDRSTDFRVRTADEPRASPIVRVSVGVKVATRVSRRVIHRGQKVRFSGTITPAHEGVAFAVQRRRSGQWVTVTGGRIKRRGRYRKVVAIRRAGLYRVYVRIANHEVDSAAGAPKNIKFG